MNYFFFADESLCFLVNTEESLLGGCACFMLERSTLSYVEVQCFNIFPETELKVRRMRFFAVAHVFHFKEQDLRASRIALRF